MSIIVHAVCIVLLETVAEIFQLLKEMSTVYLWLVFGGTNQTRDFKTSKIWIVSSFYVLSM